MRVGDVIQHLKRRGVIEGQEAGRRIDSPQMPLGRLSRWNWYLTYPLPKFLSKFYRQALDEAVDFVLEIMMA